MPGQNKEKCPLGTFLDAQLTPERKKKWRNAFFGFLGLLCLLNLIVPNHHPHFGYDKYPFFWPLFGLLVGLIMVFLVKKVIQPMIKKPEDYYGDL